MANCIVLVGFMGAGKTTLGSQLADRLGVEAFDSDRLVELAAGRKIDEIFAGEGEQNFRLLEERVVCKLLNQKSDAVITLGGGAITSARVREALKRHSVLFLDVDVDSAWSRVAHRRPLASDEKAFRELWDARRPLYMELADVVMPNNRIEQEDHAFNASVGAVDAESESKESKILVGDRYGSDLVSDLAQTLLALQGKTPFQFGKSSFRSVIRRLFKPRINSKSIRMIWASSNSGYYPIFFGEKLLSSFPAQKLISSRRNVVITDTTVERLVSRDLSDRSLTAVAINTGEESKTIDTVSKVLDRLVQADLRRDDLVLGVGGGVVGDVAGFCASIYQRGIDVIHIPTSLIAQVDSAYGGKTGVDLPQAKNYVGTFYNPLAVFVDPLFLRTLSASELSSGWAEIIKTALIAGGQLWEEVLSSEDSLIPSNDIIFNCIHAKVTIVGKDERDVSTRQLLNFGHTIGHAIETATEYKVYRHGEAVALGMLAALTIAEALELRTEVERICRLKGLPIGLQKNITADCLLPIIARDKKRRSKSVPFVLVDEPGEARYGCEVSEVEIRHALDYVARNSLQ